MMASKWMDVILWTLVSVNMLTLVLGGLITWLGYAIPVRLNQFGLLPEIAIAGGFASLLVACLGICALNYSSHYALNVYGFSCTIFIILMLPGIIPDASVKTSQQQTAANNGNINTSLPSRLVGHSNNGHLLLDIMYFSLIFLLVVLLIFAFTLAYYLRRKEGQEARMSRQLDASNGREPGLGGYNARGDEIGHVHGDGLEYTQAIPNSGMMMTGGRTHEGMAQASFHYPTGWPMNWPTAYDQRAQELSPNSLDCTCTVEGLEQLISSKRNYYLTPKTIFSGVDYNAQLDQNVYHCEADQIRRSLGKRQAPNTNLPNGAYSSNERQENDKRENDEQDNLIAIENYGLRRNENVGDDERDVDRLANERTEFDMPARGGYSTEVNNNNNRNGLYHANSIRSKMDRLQAEDPARREEAMSADHYHNKNQVLITKGIYLRTEPNENQGLINTIDKNERCKSLPRRSQTSSLSTIGHHNNFGGMGLGRRLASYEDLLLSPSDGHTTQYPDYYLDTKQKTLEDTNSKAFSGHHRRHHLHSCSRYQPHACRRHHEPAHGEHYNHNLNNNDDNNSMPEWNQQYASSRPRARCQCPAPHGSVDSRLVAQLRDGSSLTMTMLNQKNKLSNLNYLNSHHTMPTRLNTTYAIARRRPPAQVANRPLKSSSSGSVMAMTAAAAAAAAFLGGGAVDSSLSSTRQADGNGHDGVGGNMAGFEQFMGKEQNCVQMGNDFGTLDTMGTDLVGAGGGGEAILNVDSMM